MKQSSSQEGAAEDDHGSDNVGLSVSSDVGDGPDVDHHHHEEKLKGKGRESQDVDQRGGKKERKSEEGKTDNSAEDVLNDEERVVERSQLSERREDHPKEASESDHTLKGERRWDEMDERGREDDEYREISRDTQKEPERRRVVRTFQLVT